MPEQAFLYAIPHELYREDHIRKYGFHGISHRYVAERAAAMLDKNPEQFTGITCHLGNGCSLTAIRNGRSVDTSMGLTPLEGAAMGERSGDVDPGLIFHLARTKGMTIDAIQHLLNHESGLLGLSGVSNDLREIHESAQEGNARAEVAQKVFAYRIRKYIGAYLAVLGRADAVVMTGGIGENQAPMRKRIFEGLEGIGMELDPERNDRCIGREGVISADRSPIRLFVIPTNEELLIARDTHDMIKNSS